MEGLLKILKARFEKNMKRHEGMEWEKVLKRLESKPEKLNILAKMEERGGEPDVVGNEYIFYDCTVESPKGRRNICYDRKAREERKEYSPKSSALEMAGDIGIEILDEKQYRKLQTLGEFDTKTSSWVKTPEEIRSLGGALFMDRRYNHVFTYHNGADSYYAARGFRGWVAI